MIRKKVWHLFRKRFFWAGFWLLFFFLLVGPCGWGAKTQVEIEIGGKILFQEVSLLTKDAENLVAVEELFPQIGGIAYYSPIMRKIHLAYGSNKWTISLDKGEAVSGEKKILSFNSNQVLIRDHTAYVAISLLERFFGWRFVLKAQGASSSVVPPVSEQPETTPLALQPVPSNLLKGIRFYTYQDEGRTRVVLDFSEAPPLHEIKESESRVVLYLSDCVPDSSFSGLIKVEDGRVGDIRVYREEGKTVVSIALEKSVEIKKGVLGGNRPRIFFDFTDKTPLIKPSVSLQGQSEAGLKAAGKTSIEERSLPENWINLNVVVIDPGHGGEDPGCVQNGYREKDIVLAISLKLKEALKAKGFQVYLTREKDVYPTLSERMQVANSKQPFAFLSIHCNSAPSPSAQGVEVFVGDAKYRGEGAKEVAARENRLFQAEKNSSGGDVLGKTLSDSFYLSSREVAAEFASFLLDGITGETNQLKRGLKTAPLVVLSDILFPACLLEVGFLSNPTEAKKLASPVFQDKLVQGIVKGIVAFRNSSKLQRYVSGNGQ